MPWKPNWTDEELRTAVAASPTLTDCVRMLNLAEGGAARKNIKKHVERLSLDTSHWLGKRKPHKPDGVVLIENSLYRSLAGLKRRLLTSGYFEYRCNECGLSEWRGKAITLQIHHKNGVRTDNRVVNLELLCPNCHSQTENYGGRNVKRLLPEQQNPCEESAVCPVQEGQPP